MIRYDELLANYANDTADVARQKLNELFASLDLDTRLVDNVGVTADTPEEYCMVLHAKSGRLGLSRKNSGIFDELCRKIQYISESSRILLLKNPPDFSNFLTVKELVPAAKFIFINRHPIHILNSQLKAQRRNWHEKNEYIQLLSAKFARLQKNNAAVAFMRWATDPSSRIQLSRRVLTYHIVRSMNYYIRNIDSLPESDYISVRYEDLCDDPDRRIRDILDFIGTEAQMDVRYREHIRPRPLQLLPGVKRGEDELRRKFHTALVYFCYDL